MKLGLQINDYSWPIETEQIAGTLAEMASAADRSGYDSICVQDHVWQSSYMGGREGPMLECYETLTYLAAHTQRVKLIPLATAASYRFPGMLAKTVTTLDVLSGGRAWLGIGAGDYEEEARGLGLPYPPLAERYEILEETVQICLSMWNGEKGADEPFNGTHFQLEHTLNLPQSLSRPHPPIMIAGGGEQKTLPLVARYADACNLPPSPDIPRKLDILRRLCEEEGRDFDAIERTSMILFDIGDDGSNAGQILEQLRWLASMGIQTVFGRVVNDYLITPIEIMAREVIPAVAEL